MTDQDPTPDAPTARIKRIEVIGLFGLYDHVIDLKLEDRVTILHGPNGVGKTVLLQMIRALLSNELRDIAQIPFERFSAVFTDGTSVKIEVSVESQSVFVDQAGRTRTRTIKTLLVAHGENTTKHQFVKQGFYPAADIFDEAGVDGISLRRQARQFPGVRWVHNGAPEAWKPFSNPLQVHIIQAQRTLSRVGPRDATTDSPLPLSFPTVWSNAIDLERQISSLRQDYVAIAQELDQSFPTRLIQRTGQSLSPQELKRRMLAVENQRAALQNIGILDESSAKPFNVADLDTLSPAQSDVMALYVEDNEKKLGVFADLLQRVELLVRIVNDRFRNKTIRADHKQGLVVLDHRGSPLELRALSSGEQQQIIILYDLLFRVEKNALLLLDEPELSLHVLWQKRFLPDLLEIVQVAGIDALVATHSPFIVGDRSDLMVALDAEIDHDEPLQS